MWETPIKQDVFKEGYGNSARRDRRDAPLMLFVKLVTPNVTRIMSRVQYSIVMSVFDHII